MRTYIRFKICGTYPNGDRPKGDKFNHLPLEIQIHGGWAVWGTAHYFFGKFQKTANYLFGFFRFSAIYFFGFFRFDTYVTQPQSTKE
ncbi:MAG: hypothetical protein K2M92_01490, partial [Bacteroidales bacterium]|nr:hypothetical protein [Bacteroidales bacterium]